MGKAQIREQIRSRLATISPAERAELSRQTVSRLAKQEVWQISKSVLGYLALKDELDMFVALEVALKMGKTVTLPRHVQEEGVYCAAVLSGEARQFLKGAFGIPEPSSEAPVIPLNRLDFVLVPGLAFDPRGRRLGRGKGFYDRLLAQVSGIKCGVALDEQIVEELPAEPHDMAMNFILTPTRWLVVESAPTGT